MPWKVSPKTKIRAAFIRDRWARKESMTQLCARYGISRQCGYEWWSRAQLTGADLEDRSHRTKAALALGQRWRERVLAMRRQYPFSGADQLRWYLARKYPLGPWPSPRTIGRWHRAEGLTRKRKRHAARGPIIAVPRVKAEAANDVWTLDFKGWFRTRDGQRVNPLTVRDRATRYVLRVQHVERADERGVGAIMRRLFRRYGVPRSIHVDNGPPFGGVGPRGWSTLAVGWVRLGINVTYSRPGCPQDNAEHEQMHQVLQAQTARPAAATVAAQQGRFERWQWKYNCDRPNRALGMRLPSALYRPSERRPTMERWTYPSHWHVARMDPRGRFHWAGAKRVIGKAFGRQVVALKPVRTGVVAVYFGPHLLGELHARDPGAIRPVAVRHGRTRSTPSNRRGG